MKYRILLLLGGVLLLAIAIASLRGRQVQAVTDKAQAKTPIDFTMRDLHGAPVKLSSFRGKVVVVDVWATWCPYCVSEIHDLMAMQQKANKAGTPLQFLGIAMDDNIADVRHFAALHPFNYPILYRDEAQLRPFGEIEGFPTKFIIDKQGDIVGKIVGAQPMATIAKQVAPYLK